MFLLVSGRHVGAHTDGHQHGVSTQISINLGKKFLRISRIRKIAVTKILARVFPYLPSFISQILDFVYWPVLIFIFIYFELRDTENQQFHRVAFGTKTKIYTAHFWINSALEASYWSQITFCILANVLTSISERFCPNFEQINISPTATATTVACILN